MKIGIIGGGAAGMMAAITASGQNEITILERNQSLGKKLLSTGNGRCNYTNEDMDISHFHGTDTAFISDVIKQFDYDDTIDFFKSIGVYPKSKNGYIYPYSEQALSVLDCFKRELKLKGVNAVTECNVKEIIPCNDAGFKALTDRDEYSFDKLIITTGSYAAPKTGSDGSGFELIRPFDIEVNKPLPALCSLYCREEFYKLVAGVRCPAKVSIFVNDEFKKSDTGELQLTDYGISGIPVFQISYIAAKALNKKKNVTVEIDFMPELSDDEFAGLIKERKRGYRENKCRGNACNEYTGRGNTWLAEDALVGIFNNKLCKLLVERSADENIAIEHLIKHFKTEIVRTNTFDNAQVCTGGIKLTEVKDTLECKKIPGLYFAGEILDVNGDCGGYNLQWAWSSGYVAGKNASE